MVQPTSTNEAPAAGTLIGDKYEVEGLIAVGGMGCLVRAKHLLMKRPVAIKLVRPQRHESSRWRLLREARAMQALSSEHVVRVYDYGTHDDAPYIVMELLQGRDLAELVEERGPLSPELAVDLVLEACVAVAEAHAAGVVHRDIKPANLFLARGHTGDCVKVLDFGISKMEADENEDDHATTAENIVLGTPYFMSPEQLRNPRKTDAATDIWALAVTLHHLLTGRYPFDGRTRAEITAAIFTDAVPPMGSELPEGLEQALIQGLVKRPDERSPSVAAWASGLLPYATARGRRAVERMQAFAAEVDGVHPRDAARVALPTTLTSDRARTVPGEATMTADGVTSNLPDDEPVVPSSTHPRSRRGLWLVGAATLGMAAIGWISTTASSGVAPAPPQAVEPSASTPLVPSAPTSEAPPSPLSTPSSQPSATATASARARPTTHPSPAPAMAPSVRPQASPVDIDGIPILE